MTNRAIVTGSGFAFPESATQEDLWAGFFKDHYNNSPIARRIFTTAGVRQRHAVANPIVEDVSGLTTAARMTRFLPEAMPLGKESISTALTQAGLDASDIGLFAVASCTGYATPGLDILLARDIGMSDSVQRLFIGHMGCYAALPALGTVSDYVIARQRPALLLCLELTSLHIQPSTNETDQIVSHALFSDAAAALVVQPDPAPATRPGLEVVDIVAQTDVSASDHMTWDVTDLGFRMGLSARVPDVLALHLRNVVDDLLARNGLSLDDIHGWAVHPGGPRILDVAGEVLDLKPNNLVESRETLANHGNCSSATVLAVLEEVRRHRDLQPGQHVIALAFGPGLTLYATLLRAV
jgi:predicted naringenin-chalcone synthase